MKSNILIGALLLVIAFGGVKLLEYRAVQKERQEQLLESAVTHEQQVSGLNAERQVEQVRTHQIQTNLETTRTAAGKNLDKAMPDWFVDYLNGILNSDLLERT